MPKLCVDNELKTSPLSKAQTLNQQFYSAQTLNQQFYSVFTKYNKNMPSVSFPNYPNMVNIEFTAQGIVKFLQELKPGKSAGSDNFLQEY